MKTEILISGFGGQGLMRLGKIMAQVALDENKHTSWFPSYGAEMRGGTAHCFVKISSAPIASPLVEFPDISLIFNQPSLDKFAPRLKNKSLLIINTDLVNGFLSRGDVQEIGLPLNKLALECASLRVANIVALGFLTAFKNNLFKEETVVKVLKKVFDKKENSEVNLKGFYKGRDFFRQFSK